jgi:phenylpropionate dioxygenase-like ring-hydroxylating dioxygenase large terminal subunit
MANNPVGRSAPGTAMDRELWETHWHLLAHRSELATANRFVRFQVAGTEVVAFHDGENVAVFDNRCPHRGTRIFDGTHGQQRFLCRYHAWSFAKGRMIIPQRETFSCDLSDVRLDTYQTQWLGDFLFVSRRPALALDQQLAGITDMLAAISRGIDSRGDLNAYSYQCNWKIAVENALDQYHVAVIHHETLNKLKMEPARDHYLGINNLSYADVGDERVERRLRALRRFFDIEFQSEGYLAIHLFPFTFLTSTFGYSYSLQQFYPSTDPDLTAFTSRFYATRLSPKISPEAMQTFFESSLTVNHKVFAEDAEICARVPTDSWSPQIPAYLSSGEDKIAFFRRTMTAWMGDDAAEPSAADWQAARSAVVG